MSTPVDFVQAADVLAPGLSRAEQPLLEALSRQPHYQVRPIRFYSNSHRLLLLYLYGPLPALLALRRPALVHLANSWYAHLVPLLRVPAIVTCHDLIEHEDLFSGQVTIKPHRRWHLRAVLAGVRRARFLVCVSTATARQVESYLPACQDRIRVIHSGISPSFQPGRVDLELLRRLQVDQPYVLYVGSEQPRKNLQRLVHAVAIVRRSIPELTLVKVGAAQTEEGRARFLDVLREEEMATSTRILEAVTDDDLVGLYRGATATVLPSLQEGFGFPALEAMASGCPAIVSNQAALLEVTDGAALVIEPEDVRSMARGIELVATDHNRRHALIDSGLHRAAHFSWDRAARQYAELYDEVVSCASA